ncbi:hypothetical protein [Paenibacillus endoradicis]|uniref:hypothetical protein n=1 Tax=Paenibacillus endoradicis TaxID=2972487 RepID=UPI0021591445|nr:hypothetical protein [Paenibacillus endoradicis]MCR8656676.1 hypothetical protein [Paenibacillus endoradicis]
MKKNDKYNPYDDDTLHSIQQEEIRESIDARKGFNDVIKHYDAINGHQTPKRLEQLPNRIRKYVKIIIIIWVVSFLGFQIYSLINSISS